MKKNGDGHPKIIGRDSSVDKLIGLESVNLAVLLLHNAYLDEEGLDLLSLITGKLHDFAVLRVVDYRTVTTVFLLQILDDFLQIVFSADALNSGNGLAAGTLLNTDMAESLARALVLFKLFESVFSLAQISDIGHKAGRLF